MGARPRDPRSAAGVARELGVSAGTVREWLRRGAPRDDDGKLSADRIRKWRDEWKRAGRPSTDTRTRFEREPGGPKSGAPDQQPGDLKSEQAKAALRQRKAQAELAEIKVRQARRAMMTRQACIDICAARMSALKRRLTPLGRQVVSLLPSSLTVEQRVDIQQTIEAKVRDVLESIASSGRIDVSEPESPTEGSTPA